MPETNGSALVNTTFSITPKKVDKHLRKGVVKDSHPQNPVLTKVPAVVGSERLVERLAMSSGLAVERPTIRARAGRATEWRCIFSSTKCWPSSKRQDLVERKG